MHITRLALIGTAFAFGIQLYAVRASSSTRVAIIMSTEPVFAALFAVLAMKEQISVFQGIGGLLIVAASFGGRALEGKVVGEHA